MSSSSFISHVTQKNNSKSLQNISCKVLTQKQQQDVDSLCELSNQVRPAAAGPRVIHPRARAPISEMLLCIDGQACDPSADLKRPRRPPPPDGGSTQQLHTDLTTQTVSVSAEM